MSPERAVGGPRAIRHGVGARQAFGRVRVRTVTWIRLAAPISASLLSDWLAQAASIVAGRYDGRADRLWSDRPTPMELRSRLGVFPGVGPKKAAMAVEVLARDLRVPLRPVTANDVTYRV